jgi:diamine N-acetyltransferase
MEVRIMITLRDITKENLFKIIELWDTLDPEQKTCVAPNVVSIAQAYVNPGLAWPKAIYLNDDPIGFVMVALNDNDIKKEDQPAYFLWRMMIARPFQRKGYGKVVLDLLVSKCREDRVRYLYVSCDMKTPMPYQFYIDYGFIDTNVMDDDEEVLKLKIDPS